MRVAVGRSCSFSVYDTASFTLRIRHLPLLQYVSTAVLLRICINWGIVTLCAIGLLRLMAGAIVLAQQGGGRFTRLSRAPATTSS